jgi:glycosyltransferase involved in cell wall biosynthesis
VKTYAENRSAALHDPHSDDPQKHHSEMRNSQMRQGLTGQKPAPALSVIIPVYNESGTVERVLSAVGRALPGVTKEVIVVDDGSTDGTAAWLRQNVLVPTAVRCAPSLRGHADLNPLGEILSELDLSFQVLFHERNRGKGAAVRTGLANATGEVIVIQDADLEYDPNDWARMLPLIADRKVADVVYGSRFYGEPHRALYFHHYIGNRLISTLYNLLYDQMLSDIEVCYKMFTREVLQDLTLTADDFGIEIEISAQIARARRWRIYEVGISYYGRTYLEGKKIKWHDGLKALLYLLKYRIQR